MIKDLIVREVREIRHKIEFECRGDPRAFYEWLIASQQKLAERLARRQPRRLPVGTMKELC
jgi:hypothetical protein